MTERRERARDGRRDRGRRGPRLRLGVERSRRTTGPQPAAVVRDLPRGVRGPAAAARFFPALETAGSLLFLAVGVAFLVSWLVNRGMGSLYLGSIIVALAAPDLLVAAGVPDGSGLGTLCLGIAFLFIALVRA